MKKLLSSSPLTHYEASPPPMNICLLAPGSRGDVQPFIALGKRLKRDGHRIRLASHGVFRKLVTDQGLEFGLVDGDPRDIIPAFVRRERDGTGSTRNLPETEECQLESQEQKQQMPSQEDILIIQFIHKVIKSCYAAVCDPDPDCYGDGQPGPSFKPDAIFATPATFSHLHVGEKLGVPVHLIFLYPTIHPTKQFPHLMSKLSVQLPPNELNFKSFVAADASLWKACMPMVNHVRAKLGLPETDEGNRAVRNFRIGQSFAWSRHLMPKPSDWPEEIEIDGFMMADLMNVDSEEARYTPPQDLVDFLSKGDPPIFVGFSSVVTENPERITKILLEASKMDPSTRIVIQSGWAKLSEGVCSIPSNVLFIGDCPHSWLLPKVAGVIHHGGAGTVAASVLAGKPSFVVPFVNDQHLWGLRLERSGIAVPSCHVKYLNPEILVNAFRELKSQRLEENAKQIQVKIQEENGVENIVRSFYKKLPQNSMLSDITPSKVAHATIA